MNKTQKRIRQRWIKSGHRPLLKNVLSGGDTSEFAEGVPTYPASSVTDMSSDFLGDWRAADSWMRFDMWRVRNRSRQLERGNPLCIAFKRNMLNNVLGFKGFYERANVVDDNDKPDVIANKTIDSAREEFGKPINFTTRKRLSRRDEDKLILSRLIFDGEVILRKQRGFNNDFGFAWQNVNPDYLDHNLNRVEPNGNITKMGVEMDATFKFPVAYWFLKRRPNDYFYNYQDLNQQRYIRVNADEVIHFYLLTEDDEQTRGWPWVFSAAVTLFRLGKYQEAALINAAIGASRGVYFEKKYPEGFVGDPSELQDDAEITLDLPQGSALELPFGTVPHAVNMQYPDKEFADFNAAMLLTAGNVFGTSYATTSGDLSKANFVSSRIGQTDERELYKSVQQYMIDKWKLPGAEEELYRSMLVGKVNLPLGKFSKFNQFAFTGKRWPFIQPVDDMKASEMKLNNLTCSVSDIIEETTQEGVEEVFKRIDRDNQLMKKYGLQRITSAKSEAIGEDQPPVPGTAGTPEPSPTGKEP